MTSKIRVMVLGATGMLGHRLANGLLDRAYDVIVAVRERPTLSSPYLRLPAFQDSKNLVTGIDAVDWRKVNEVILFHRPDFVVNCIGITKQNPQGKDAVLNLAINALFPYTLDEAVSSYGARLIHFSTDCVFDGKRGGYSELDVPDATDWYGRAKAIGEVVSENTLTIRTSFIGPEITGHLSLIDWFLSQSGNAVDGYSRAIYSGITTRETVNVVDLVIRDHKRLCGLFQVASDPISKYELLNYLCASLGLDIKIRQNSDFQIDRSMRSEKFEQATGYRAPGWPHMLGGLVDDIRHYWELGWATPPKDYASDLT